MNPKCSKLAYVSLLHGDISAMN